MVKLELFLAYMHCQYSVIRCFTNVIQFTVIRPIQAIVVINHGIGLRAVESDLSK